MVSKARESRRRLYQVTARGFRDGPHDRRIVESYGRIFRLATGHEIRDPGERGPMVAFRVHLLKLQEYAHETAIDGNIPLSRARRYVLQFGHEPVHKREPGIRPRHRLVIHSHIRAERYDGALEARGRFRAHFTVAKCSQAIVRIRPRFDRRAAFQY